MDPGYLRSHWALLAAAGIALIVAAVIVLQLVKRSAGGQLREAVRALRKARLEEQRARRAVDSAERRLTRLQDNAAQEKPRHLQEAKEALRDAKSLAKIVGDKVLIAENHVRRVILEEFPPVKQERLRERYSLREGPDKRPFSF